MNKADNIRLIKGICWAVEELSMNDLELICDLLSGEILARKYADRSEKKYIYR